MKIRDLLPATALVAVCAYAAPAPEISTPPGATYRSNIPAEQRRVFFGELHLHTTMSFDAWTFGTKVTPDQAYKFGRGETILVPASQLAKEEGIEGTQDVPVKRSWPLDFMAVTDHSESMGILDQLDDPDSALTKTPLGRELLKTPSALWGLMKWTKKGLQPPAGLNSPDVIRHAWDVEIKAAKDNYEPGKFTTLIAYEWSSMPEGRYNLHRNVFFNSDHAPLPFSSYDSSKPEDLWSYLEKTRAQGIDVIAIPHNGNASGGLMYDWNDSDGRPIDEHYAQRRALNEPLTEIVQNKGQSDTVPALSPNDEFANFEIWDHLLTSPDAKSNPNGSYIRQAFGRGLVIQSKVGVNPYKYGVVGASDFHNGLSASDESAFASGPYGLDPSTIVPKGDAAKRALGIIKTAPLVDVDALTKKTAPKVQNPLEFSGAGITGVWAETNTRNAIFAALKRKETFATSGTRIRVRVFGGWNFGSDVIRSGDWVSKAYADGVPMGGDLPAKPASASAPRFILQAVKDPDGANLDRIQVIKIWLEGDDYREKIFDAALSDDRKDNPKTGRAPDVGNTVDLKTGTYKNTIGAGILTAVWQDPQFDAAKPAVYYVRVLEIPTPRWSTLLAVKNKLPIPTSVAATLQERAWSSPIWYTPAAL